MRGREISAGSLGGPSTDVSCTICDLEHRFDADVAKFVEWCHKEELKQCQHDPL